MRIDTHSPGAARPEPGTLWVWKPEAPDALALIRVTKTQWNGEQWTVAAEVLAAGEGEFGKLEPGREYWNELSRFWEACYRVAHQPGLVGTPAGIRRGALQPGEDWSMLA